MQKNADRYYQALVSRDPRFDGQFYAGVVTTGVYCRPTCPAPDPKPINVRYFSCAAAAEAAGFRPCRRCRPDTVPGTPAWLGTSATVSRALRLISDGALDEAGVDTLAERLGVGSRHLRRLFDRHLGVSPVRVAQSRRIHFARNLLDETDMPMREIAYASGFSSVKRFNTVIRETFRKTPSELRRMAQSHEIPADAGGISLRLPYRKPYDWDGMLEYLGARAIPGVEQVRDGVYRRAIRLDDRPTLVEVRKDAKRPFLVLRLSSPVRRELIDVVERVRRLFDLGANPALIASQLEQDPLLRRAVRQRPGLRVPGAWNPFELTVRAILGQQISVKGATTLAGRVAKRFGTPIHGASPEGPTHLFPGPADLAEAELESLGMPGARAEAIREVARRIHSGELVLCSGDSPESIIEKLTELPGIGPWTAQYVAMRAFGHPDVFLPGDLGVRKALEVAENRPFTEKKALERAEAWRPWRAYAVLHLWLSLPHRNGKESSG